MVDSSLQESELVEQSHSSLPPKALGPQVGHMLVGAGSTMSLGHLENKAAPESSSAELPPTPFGFPDLTSDKNRELTLNQWERAAFHRAFQLSLRNCSGPRKNF